MNVNQSKLPFKTNKYEIYFYDTIIFRQFSIQSNLFGTMTITSLP